MELPFFTTGTSSNAATTRAEALRWLAIAEKLLAGRDLVGGKSFAARARESDPTLLYADQIITVADTLLAGDNRINNQPDWYSILQLSGHQTGDSELIASQYRKLALLLNPQKNKLPFADQAFTLVMNAWSVLSNPSRKHLYDNELLAHLRVNSVSSGFNPITAGVSREQVNYQPFEINFQVMPQAQHGIVRERVSQPLPQHGMSREQVNQFIPQSNASQEQLSQLLPQQNLSREQVRQPQPQTQPHPTPPLQPQPKPQPQHQPQPQQQSQSQQRKEYWIGSNVAQNVSGSAGNINTSTNDDRTRNDDGINANIGSSDAREEETTVEASSDDGELSFWTACPYCYYMYEYPSVYKECILRCQNCKKAFHGVVIPSPPPIVDGQEAYLCCWGFMPLGVSMDILEKNKGKGGNWMPFSPMFTCPKGMGNNGSAWNVNNAGGWNVKNNVQGSRSGNVGSRKNSGPRVYVDDDDVFLEYSDPSEESDDDWSNQKKKKTKRVKRKVTGTPGRKAKKAQADKGKNVKGESSENVQDGTVHQEGVAIPNPSVAESSKKGAVTTARRQPARVAKDFRKLDLNVEFSNEAEEPVRRVSQGNGTARGEEDIIEGSAFFEGLDEFLSSLPILNVVGDDKVKAA